MEQPMAWVLRMKTFFGQKPGESIAEFKAECDALNIVEKQWFTDQFNAVGMPTLDPVTR